MSYNVFGVTLNFTQPTVKVSMKTTVTALCVPERWSGPADPQPLYFFYFVWHINILKVTL